MKIDLPIEVVYVHPPIPYRDMDWQATFAWFDGDDDQPVGRGRTAQDAIVNLLTSDPDSLMEAIDAAHLPLSD